MPRYPKKTREEKEAAKDRCSRRQVHKSHRKWEKGKAEKLGYSVKKGKPKPLTNSMLNLLENIWAVPSQALRPGVGSIRRQLIKRGLLESYEEENTRNVQAKGEDGEQITVTRTTKSTYFRLTVEGEKLVRERQANNPVGRIELPSEMTRDIRGDEYKALKKQQEKQKSLDDEIEKIAQSRRDNKAPGKV